jgi:signal transduction histidine kinase/ActR/RegA family two-component response regulator
VIQITAGGTPTHAALAGVLLDTYIAFRAMEATHRTFDGQWTDGQSPNPGHSVHFYSRELPAEEIAGQLAAHMGLGAAVVLVARRQHLVALATALASHDLDLAEARGAGQLIEREAHEALAALTVNGRVVGARFQEEIGGIIDRAAERFPSVVVYGEMVDVLAQAGDLEQAMALEQIWNGFLPGRSVTLMCGYAYHAFDRDLAGDGFAAICDQHDRVAGGRTEAEVGHQSRALDLVRDRVERLARVTSALCDAVSVSAVAEVISTEMAAALGADQAILALPSQDETRLSLVGSSGLRPETLAEYGSFSVAAQLPVAVAFTTGCPLWLSSPAAIARQFPDLRPSAEVRAIACLPLQARGRRLGAVGFGFRTPRAFLPAGRSFFEDMARQAALALDRARLQERTEKARQRLQLLADASAHFSRPSADVDQVLGGVAAEVIRHIADCCVICLDEEGGSGLRLAAVQHVDPSLEPAIRQSLLQAPLEVGVGPLGGVVASGQALLVPAVGRSGLAPWSLPAAGPTRRTTSLLVVPMRVSGRTIGALAVSRAGRDPAFIGEDRDLLQDLGDRAALFVENANLFRRAQREWARAEEANRAKDEFLAMLGHELRNPLAPIRTALDLMRLRGGDALCRERTIIERQVAHMTRLVDDLLDVSRVTRGKLTLKRTVGELGEVVADAVEMARPLVEQRDHILHIEVPAGLLVDGDRSRLTQAVVNLVTNAATYTPPGGRIEIAARAHDSSVELEIRDNGAGVEPALLPRMFDLFVQGPRDIDRAQGGLGLGLPIVRAIVEMHGGTVSARSEGRGRGCQMLIRLPLAARAAAAETAAAPGVSSAARPLPAKVLVVDDNRDAAESLGEALGELGYQSRVVHDGAAALLAAEEFRPDVALLDIGLPVMDGYELASLLRAQLGAAAPRIVAVTGYGLDADRARSEAAGFCAHLVKPIDLDQLESLVNGVNREEEPTARTA